MGTVVLNSVTKEDLERTGKLNETGLTPQEIADAIKKSHDSAGTSLTPEQTATLDKLDDVRTSTLTPAEIREGIEKGFVSSKFVVLTQAEYDALTPETDVFYAITE